jgi:hypothetical protein
MARRGPLAAGFAAALVLGFAALLLAGGLTRSDQVQTLGVLPVAPVGATMPGTQTCERDVTLAEPFEAVRFTATTFGEPGPALAVTVRARSGRLLGSGRAPAGWREESGPRNVPVGRVVPGAPVSICVRNVGRIKAWVWGDSYRVSKEDPFLGIRKTIEPAYATVVGRRAGDADLSLAFTAREPRSLLTRLPGMFRHAALFRPSFVGAWLFWVLLAAMVLAAPPLLLVAAARAAKEDDGDDPPVPEPPPAGAPEPARERVASL